MTPRRKHSWPWGPFLRCLRPKEREQTMNAPLRVNEALLIADHAFEPFQCVAWDQPNGTGELCLAVIDRTSTRIGGKQVSSSIYSDPARLAVLIEEVRAELCEKGYSLQPWTMPT